VAGIGAPTRRSVVAQDIRAGGRNRPPVSRLGVIITGSISDGS
jgi:hypothetical protein